MVNVLSFLLPPIIISLPQTFSAIDFQKLSLSTLPDFLRSHFPAHFNPPSIHEEGTFVPPDGLQPPSPDGVESGFVTIEELYQRYISGLEAVYGGGVGEDGEVEEKWEGGEVKFVWFTQVIEEKEEEDEEKEAQVLGEADGEVVAVIQEVEEVLVDGHKETLVVQEVKQVLTEGSDKPVEIVVEVEKWDGDRVFNDSAIAISQAFESANPIPPPVVPVTVHSTPGDESSESGEQPLESEAPAPALPPRPKFVYINCAIPNAQSICNRFWITSAQLPKLFVITPDLTIYPVPHNFNLTTDNYTTLWEEKGWESHTPWTGAFNPLTGAVSLALDGKVGEVIGQGIVMWALLPAWVLTILAMLTLRRVTVWVMASSEKKDEGDTGKGKDIRLRAPKVVVQNGDRRTTTVVEPSTYASSS